MVTKEHIHKLVDQILEDDLPEVAHYLENLRTESDPFLRALANAPIDDEPVTPEEAAAVAVAKADLARGEVKSLEEVRAECLRKP
jgi:ABC-type proline/glycine betaine transport system substrate-binding protein